MTTTADVLSRVRRRIMGGSRDQLNKLDEALDASEVDVTFEFDLQGIAPGARVAVNLEEFYIWSKVDSNKTATVQRGYNGSTAATHADGDLAYVNPVVSDFEILRAVNAELDALSSPSNGLFRVATVDVTFSPAVQGYDLTSVTAVEGIVGVFADQPGSSQNWVPVRDYRLSRNQSTTDFASGFSITLLDGAMHPGRSVRVAYKGPFTNLSAVGQDVEAISGLHAQAHDILELGAALRLLSGRSVRRAFTEGQGETRRAEEVTVRDVLSSTAALRQEYEERVAEESSRLAARWPQVRAA